MAATVCASPTPRGILDGVLGSLGLPPGVVVVLCAGRMPMVGDWNASEGQPTWLSAAVQMHLLTVAIAEGTA